MRIHGAASSPSILALPGVPFAPPLKNPPLKNTVKLPAVASPVEVGVGRRPGSVLSIVMDPDLGTLYFLN